MTRVVARRRRSRRSGRAAAATVVATFLLSPGTAAAAFDPALQTDTGGGADPPRTESARTWRDEDPPPGVGLSRAVADLELHSNELAAAEAALASVRERRERDSQRVDVIVPELERLRLELGALDSLTARRAAQVAKAEKALERAKAAVRELAIEWFVTGFGALEGLDPALTAEERERLDRGAVLAQAAAHAALSDEVHLTAHNAALTADLDLLEKRQASLGERVTELESELARLLESIRDANERLPRLEADVQQAAMGARVVGTDLSATALDAYWRAERMLAQRKPRCGVTWWVLAGIGRIESQHGTYRGSRLAVDGTVDPPIFGPHLDGSNAAFAIVPDTDGGAIDGIAGSDRAVGPMQFLPGTWRRVAVDATGSGRPDPHNLFDAAATAGVYLCRSGPNLGAEESLRRALLTYNRSGAYVDAVLARGRGYRQHVDLDGGIR